MGFRALRLQIFKAWLVVVDFFLRLKACRLQGFRAQGCVGLGALGFGVRQEMFLSYKVS